MGAKAHVAIAKSTRFALANAQLGYKVFHIRGQLMTFLRHLLDHYEWFSQEKRSAAIERAAKSCVLLGCGSIRLGCSTTLLAIAMLAGRVYRYDEIGSVSVGCSCCCPVFTTAFTMAMSSNCV